jgi:biotin carboxyl carrier protein
MSPAPPPPGEWLSVPERVIVAPGTGVFRPAHVGAGTVVAPGDVVGELVGRDAPRPVHSPFAGTVMGLLAHPGERLREGQPVAWLRVG